MCERQQSRSQEDLSPKEKTKLENYIDDDSCCMSMSLDPTTYRLIYCLAEWWDIPKSRVIRRILKPFHPVLLKLLDENEEIIAFNIEHKYEKDDFEYGFDTKF